MPDNIINNNNRLSTLHVPSELNRSEKNILLQRKTNNLMRNSLPKITWKTIDCWRFNAKKDYREGGGEMVFLSIDESEAEKIVKNGNRLHFEMSRIKCVIRGGKKVQQA